MEYKGKRPFSDSNEDVVRDQYIDLVEKMYFLCHHEMQELEGNNYLFDLSMSGSDPDKRRHKEFAKKIVRIISLVNTIGFLRGQDGMFNDIRPPATVSIGGLYRFEDDLENRLRVLIDYIESEESGVTDFYHRYLHRFYVASRSKVPSQEKEPYELW